MENDKFQELVLEHLGRLTQEITEFRQTTDAKFKRIDERFDRVDEKFKQVDERFKQVDERFDRVDERFDQSDKRFERVEKKLDATTSQTAELTEFRMDTGRTLEKIVDSLDFLKSRQFNMEEELFRLKKKIS